MENSNLYPGVNSIYPGEYVPLLDEEEMRAELKRTTEKGVIPPQVFVTDTRDWFMVEVTLPGLKREDFLIQADENILSITALHKQNDINMPGNNYLGRPGYTCFDSHVILPQNVDVEFVSAEYKENVLHINMCKTNQLQQHPHSRIVVY